MSFIVSGARGAHNAAAAPAKEVPTAKTSFLESAKRIWASQRFEPVGAYEDMEKRFESLVTQAQTRMSTGQLTALQAQRASRSAYSFLHGYSAKTFADYMTFRAPVPEYTYDRAKSDWARSTLINYGKVPAAEIPVSDADLFNYCWTKEVWCGKSYIEGVAIETIAVAFGRDARPPDNDDFKALLPTIPTFGAKGYYPTILFTDQPRVAKSKSQLSIHGLENQKPAGGMDVLCMTVACVVQPRSPDFPVPITFRSYWSEKNAQWLPLGVTVLCTRRWWDPHF